MRVLISAYACAPDEGSEPGVGWAWSTAAAEFADVTLMTRSNNVEAVEAALARDPRSLSMTVVGLEAAPLLMRGKNKVPGGVQLYYLVWQRALRKKARELAASEPFDVAHHVTFAGDWLPTWGAQGADAPLVSGPLAGATYTPFRCYRYLGAVGAVKELIRSVLTRALRRMLARPSTRRAQVVVAASSDTASALGGWARRVVIEPNCVVDLPLGSRDQARPASPDDLRHLAVVGRLVDLKGWRLALEVLRELPDEWVLDFFGEGPARHALQRRVKRLGLAPRVTLHGSIPRDELLRQLGTQDVLLAPGLHEGVGWAVAEAMAQGLPVVAVDIGGHRDVLEGNGRLEGAGPELPTRLARAVRAAAEAPATPTSRWSSRRLSAFLAELYAGAAERPDTSGSR